MGIATARSRSLWPTPSSAGTSAPRAPTASSSGTATTSRGRCARYLDGWQEYSFELEDIAEVSPGKVVGICRERGVDSKGVPVDRRFGGLWVVEDAKIVSWSTYLTPREAVRAARELGDRSSRFRERPVQAVAQAPKPKPPDGEKPAPLDEKKRRAAKARAKLQRRQRQAAG